jgi:hypothetical protein
MKKITNLLKKTIIGEETISGEEHYKMNAVNNKEK